MELTLQQISYLLEVAAKSPFTAEQIAGLIRERAADDIIPLNRVPTIREWFSKDNITSFTENKPLATRIFHIMERFFYHVGDLGIDEFVVHPQVGPIHRWKDCGVQSQRVIRLMFAHYGYKIP